MTQQTRYSHAVSISWARRIALSLMITAAPFAAQAQTTQTDPDEPEVVSGPKDEIVVFGRAEHKIGTATAASEGTISGSDLLVRPLLRVAELLEAVPGMVAAQHSGSGKANQYFLRGFNLDHGSDFTTYIDGVQMNFRTHGHGQGYLDLNGLIPEIIAREDFRKGPYRADGGDFALAGAAYMQTVENFDRPWVAAEVGSHGSRRLAAGGTIERPNGDELTLVAQVKRYDGPWEEPEKLRHYAGFMRYSAETGMGALDFTTHAYHGTWHPTEQIPERIIGSDICPDAYCSPDPTARGRTTRIVNNLRLQGDDWDANAYVQFYDWRMSSNPTYANADGSSAQIDQFDKRWIFGLKGEKEFEITQNIDLRIGTENRYDHISNVGVDQTDARQFVSTFGRHKVTEGSVSAYAETEISPIEPLRITAGLRGDYYWYDVIGKEPVAVSVGEGSGHASIASPKIAAAWRLTDTVELYANWGRGFHSNDVRGAVSATPVPLLVRGTGKELGGRVQMGTFSLTATYWWLNLDSELRFVGDANSVEPTGASKRHGYELVGFWRPAPWLALDANYTASHARYSNGDYVPNAFENAASAGITAVFDRWEGSLRMRHLGPAPLIEDNSVRDDGSTVFNLRGAYKPGGMEIFGEVLNVFDSKDKDIAYYYESYVPAFDSTPVEDRLSRIVEPRTVRIGAKLYF